MEVPTSVRDRGTGADPSPSVRDGDGVIVGPLPVGNDQATRDGTGPSTRDEV